MVDTRVNLSGWMLDNPVIPASGTFGFGYEFHQFYDINILGSIALKGTTKEPRFGNPTPRIADCCEGMLNSVGLQNPGVHAVIANELKKLQKVFAKKAIANVSGFSQEEYVYTASMLDKCEQIGIIELNISCPNVSHGGMSFGTDATRVEELVRSVKRAVTKPLYVKLTPNVTDIVAIAKGAERGGADGLSLINTLLGMRIDMRSKKPVLANKKGGFSGRAVFPVALRMVYEVYESVKLPIIGMGGIADAENVLEMMYAGATAVQVGAENLVNPYACKDIIEQLQPTMQKYGITKLSDIIGVAHR